MSKTSHVTHGAEDDLLYVSEGMRRCATCEAPKPLGMFYHNPDTLRTSLNCRKCIEESKRARQAEQQASTEDLLVTTLAKATGRTTLLDAAPKSSDFARAVLRNMGGEEAAAKYVSRVQKKAMKGANLGVAVKGANSLIALLLHAEKQTGEPIDLSELTAEQRMLILMEPARQLLLENPEFRRMLLQEADVRRALFAEEGIQVLEVSADGQ